jgi:serine/threonine-protein kinase RsbW
MPSRRQSVVPTVERVLDLVEDVGLDHDRLENLAVALAEALSNAAVHGNHLDAGIPVHITLKVEPGSCATVDVRDEGKGFDVSSVRDPTDPAELLNAAGRGVFLMRRLVDRLEYNRAGNRVRLTMERNGTP